MTDSAILEIIKQLGIPMGLLVVVGLSLWRAATWLANRILVPLLERQMAFIDRLEKSITDMGESLKATSELNKQTKDLIFETGKEVIENRRVLNNHMQQLVDRDSTKLDFLEKISQKLPGN